MRSRSISYVTDPASGGTGILIDDTRLVVGGETVEAEASSEASEPGQAAEGSPTTGGDFGRSQALIDSAAATATANSVTLGFGLEQVETREQRADLMAISAHRFRVGLRVPASGVS